MSYRLQRAAFMASDAPESAKDLVKVLEDKPALFYGTVGWLKRLATLRFNQGPEPEHHVPGGAWLPPEHPTYTKRNQR